MAAKKNKKPEKKEPAKTPPIIEKQDEHQKPDQFDFGGLPQRDLKKNLGCG